MTTSLQKPSDDTGDDINKCDFFLNGIYITQSTLQIPDVTNLTLVKDLFQVQNRPMAYFVAKILLLN